MRKARESNALEERARKILEFLGQDEAEAAIHVVDGETMKGLNRQFRGKDETTTVLSFEDPGVFPRIPGEKRMLGEVFLDPECIRSRGGDIDHFLVHGVLHLLGFSHEEKGARIEMEKIEDKVLAWLKSRY